MKLTLLLLACCLLAGCLSSKNTVNTRDLAAKKNAKKGDYVIILHGIFLGSGQMRKLASYLEHQGYDVLNVDYPSTKASLEELTEIIHKDIQNYVIEDKTIHFVGFSMGGLLVRAILHQYPPEHLGRVVQLATPNQGSEVADFLKNNGLYKKYYGPAGQQLITNQTALTPLFGEVYYELGIIAGNASLDPISSFLIKGENDGKVSVTKTKCEGMKDHIVIKATHTFFPFNKEVQRQTAYFLQHGVFDHQNK